MPARSWPRSVPRAGTRQLRARPLESDGATTGRVGDGMTVSHGTLLNIVYHSINKTCSMNLLLRISILYIYTHIPLLLLGVLLSD